MRAEAAGGRMEMENDRADPIQAHPIWTPPIQDEGGQGDPVQEEQLQAHRTAYSRGASASRTSTGTSSVPSPPIPCKSRFMQQSRATLSTNSTTNSVPLLSNFFCARSSA